MAHFTISAGTAAGKTWKAVGKNPHTGRSLTIQGGQKGTAVGRNNPDSEKTFDARHNATGMTPKKYINKLRWDNKAEFGTTVNIPDELFKPGKAKPSSTKASGPANKPAKKTRVSAPRPKKAASTQPKAAAKKSSSPAKKTTARSKPKKAAPRAKAAAK